MANQSMKRFFHHLGFSINMLKKQESYKRFAYKVLVRCQSQSSETDKAETDGSREGKDVSRVPVMPNLNKQINYDSRISKYSSDEENLNDNKRKLEVDWIMKALEPAVQLYRWALPTGNNDGQNSPSSSRSFTEIVAHIQRSKVGIQDWSLSDLTVGLFLVYLRQAAAGLVEDVKGVQISSESIVQELIYHIELAKGAYKENAASLARHSMLREKNILKFVKNSNVMRPGYYIGIDTRYKLVVLGIRGTHTVYDLITDIVSSSEKEMTFEGYSTHFGTTEAARWFLHHEVGTLRKCLEKHEGFRLRLVGHSLGGATASLLAIMLRKKSQEELGFSPDIVSAIGIATPPCVSKELAESCCSYVSTIVLQDDIIPRLSVASLTRLRNEIFQTNWSSVLEKEEWKTIIDLVANAKQVVSSVQDVARKLADYANFRSKTNDSDVSIRKISSTVAKVPSTPKPATSSNAIVKQDKTTAPEELFVPGTMYYLKRNVDKGSGSSGSKSNESFSLWKRHAGEHFQRIILSSNLISDHKCDSHYYALRDVLKGLPAHNHESIY
ncbi:PREDICTED: sn1-specific diacylglycerol lipase beta [Nelumbo nucifera]|uniref:Sn1-specific diacylglycerol lipase beta n=2 Tax=Nelumbo nucifera TaxID=4432 RepID=A0A1U8A536_NELNU|nr:PREDICTED: sn1-specific diacylglycerol lipase beta [Nelumbo nucifera]DAD36743.1 TPA_asm: hypothetical protein HUJ06_007384 [Nelumbo nucifera]